jgi:hypothetical protein
LRPRTTRVISLVALLAFIATTTYWILAPYRVFSQIQEAAQAGDASRFNVHVDYPRVRASLKEQIARKMGKDSAGDPLVALGASIGMALANPIVDAVVTPEAIMRAIQDGQLTFQIPRPASAPGQTGGRVAGPEKPNWRYEWRDMNHLVAHLSPPVAAGAPAGHRLRLELERIGLMDWKLVDVQLEAPEK